MILLTGARLVTLTDEVTRQIQRFTEPPESLQEEGGQPPGIFWAPFRGGVAPPPPPNKDGQKIGFFGRRAPPPPRGGRGGGGGGEQ